MSAWNKEAIRSLRLRLGISQCDFARQIGMSRLSIIELEEGRTDINNDLINQLEFLSHTADFCQDELQQSSLIDKIIFDEGLDQIAAFDLFHFEAKK